MVSVEPMTTAVAVAVAAATVVASTDTVSMLSHHDEHAIQLQVQV